MSSLPSRFICDTLFVLGAPPTCHPSVSGIFLNNIPLINIKPPVGNESTTITLPECTSPKEWDPQPHCTLSRTCNIAICDVILGYRTATSGRRAILQCRLFVAKQKTIDQQFEVRTTNTRNPLHTGLCTAQLVLLSLHKRSPEILPASNFPHSSFRKTTRIQR